LCEFRVNPFESYRRSATGAETILRERSGEVGTGSGSAVRFAAHRRGVEGLPLSSREAPSRAVYARFEPYLLRPQ